MVNITLRKIIKGELWCEGLTKQRIKPKIYAARIQKIG